MKTYRELVAEAKSFHPYDKWGVLTPDDEFISGNDHPTAKIHLNLVSHLKKSYYRDAVTYAQEGDTLNIRTGTKKGVQLAVKHFARFPHTEARKVRFDHTPVAAKDWNKATNKEGRPHEVLAHMKKVAGIKEIV